MAEQTCIFANHDTGQHEHGTSALQRRAVSMHTVLHLKLQAHHANENRHFNVAAAQQAFDISTSSLMEEHKLHKIGEQPLGSIIFHNGKEEKSWNFKEYHKHFQSCLIILKECCEGYQPHDGGRQACRYVESYDLCASRGHQD